MSGLLSFLAFIVVLTVFIFFVIVPMFSNNSDSNSGTGSDAGSDVIGKAIEDLNRDCVGEWGDCDQNTCNQTYTITTQSKGNGAKCPNKNGDTQTCSTGLCKDTTCDENGKSKNSKFCCNYGKPKDGLHPSYGNQQKCKENSCDSGYILDSDDICQPSYFCDHGEPVKGVVTIKNSDGKLVPIENCNSCKDGRVLVKDGDVSTCNFSYTCPNGVKNSGSPPVGGIVNCKSCNTGFSLTSPTSGKYKICTRSSYAYDYLGKDRVFWITNPDGGLTISPVTYDDKTKTGHNQILPCRSDVNQCKNVYHYSTQARQSKIRLMPIDNKSLYRLESEGDWNLILTIDTSKPTHELVWKKYNQDSRWKDKRNTAPLNAQFEFIIKSPDNNIFRINNKSSGRPLQGIGGTTVNNVIGTHDGWLNRPNLLWKLIPA